MLRRGQGDINPHFLGGSKVSAQPRLQRQQRCNNSTTAPALQTLAFLAAAALLCPYVCAVFTRRYLYMHLRHDHICLFPRTILHPKHVVEPHSAIVYSGTRGKGGTSDDDGPPFQLATPTDFKPTTSRRETLTLDRPDIIS